MAFDLNLLAAPLAPKRNPNDFHNLSNSITNATEIRNRRQQVENQTQQTNDATRRTDKNIELTDLQIEEQKRAITEAGKDDAMRDYAFDIVGVNASLQAGDLAGARTRLLDRLSKLNEKRKTDPSVNTKNTEGLLELLETDPTQFARVVDEELKASSRTGHLTGIGKAGNKSYAPVTLINPTTKEKILASPVVNDAGTGLLVEFTPPAGFQISAETPEEKRQAEVLAALTKVTDKLEAERDLKPTIAADVAQAEDSVKKADMLFEATEKISLNIANLSEARQALIDGAGTGPIERFWPSFREASVRLDNIQGRLGLDVVGATTFGALSKGELDLSKQVALPTGMQPEKLAEWLEDRIAAQEAKQDYLQRQAIFLSEKNEEGKQNTRADWAKAEKGKLDAALSAFEVSEDDIKETMRANEMTRSDVLTEIRRRFENGGA